MSEVATEAPLTLDEIVAGLIGFGIEECETPIIINSGPHKVELVFSNTCVEEERLALLACEEFKGYTWMQQTKVEIISRSIAKLNGVSIHLLKGKDRLVVDPTDGMKKDIQVVLRELVKSWGQEVVAVIWKLLMVHLQNIEDRLLESFSDVQRTTEVEARYRERAEQEVDAVAREVIRDQLNNLFQENAPAAE